MWYYDVSEWQLASSESQFVSILMFSKMLPYSFADMQPGTAIIGFNESQKMLLCVFHYRGIISSLWPSIPFSALSRRDLLLY